MLTVTGCSSYSISFSQVDEHLRDVFVAIEFSLTKRKQQNENSISIPIDLMRVVSNMDSSKCDSQSSIFDNVGFE